LTNKFKYTEERINQSSLTEFWTL